MKNSNVFIFFLAFCAFVFSGCEIKTPPIIGENPEQPSNNKDSLKTRTPLNKKGRLSVKDAFLRLSNKELLLDGIESMPPKERNNLLKLNETADYKIQWAGNYLCITEKAKNTDDEEEQVEQIRMAAFNSLNKKNILFVSQELVDEQRNVVKILKQSFLQYTAQDWENVDYKLPVINTATFLNKNTTFKTDQDHIFFELKATDLNYLQAHLKHDEYLDKDAIAKMEAYKVALIWTGSEFRLDRQAMVSYDISEHHPDE